MIPVASPPWSGLGRRIERRIRKALYAYEMADPKIAVALSGGKDSLTLLYMLAAISGRGFPEFELTAIHVGGAFTCGAGVQVDALRDLCERMGVRFLLREANQDPETIECYGCSRERRRLLFEAAESVGARTIAFGHHRDDNAETLLLNLLQKGEFAGMLPKIYMHHYDKTIIRPLIFVPESDIIEFADQQKFRRILCRCPVGQNSMRKKVDDLIGELENQFPDVRENLARASLVYGSDKAAKPPKKKVQTCINPAVNTIKALSSKEWKSP